MKKSFSLIELIIVIIIVGVLYSSINFTLSNTSLNQAVDKLIAHINYTRHLALKDNKMQYYPVNNTLEETNRSKYWFKGWWQLRIGKNSNDYFYEIFSDSPDSSNIYDRKGNPVSEFAIDFYNGLYMAGNYVANSNKELNLSYYNIKVLKYNDVNLTMGNSIRIIFDNYGNCYTSEGSVGDGGDINPYDKDKRIPLMKISKITLCQDDNCENNLSICMSPKIGNAYLCK